MAQQPVGQTGSPIGSGEPPVGGVPQVPTPPAMPEGPFVEVDGKQISQGELLNTYRNKDKWTATNTQRAQEIARERAALEELRQEMEPLMQADETFFRRYPGSKEELIQAVESVRRKYALGSTQTSAMPPGQQPGQPDISTLQERLDAMEQHIQERETQAQLDGAWRSFKQAHPDMTEPEEYALRGMIPFVNTAGLDDRGILEQAWAKVSTWRQAPTPSAEEMKNKIAAMGGIGPTAPTGGTAQPVDLAGKPLREQKDYFKQRLQQGEYGNR